LWVKGDSHRHNNTDGWQVFYIVSDQNAVDLYKLRIDPSGRLSAPKPIACGV